MKVKLLSLEGLEKTSLKVGDEGEAISKVSGGGLKNGYWIIWNREIRENCSFDVRNQCAVERNQLEFLEKEDIYVKGEGKSIRRGR